MNWQTFKTHRPLQALTFMSIAIFPSIFIGGRVMGVAFLLYMLSIAWCIVSSMGIDILSRLSDSTWENGQEAKKDKKYLMSSVYFVTFPMVMVGIIMALIMIFTMIIFGV